MSGLTPDDWLAIADKADKAGDRAAATDAITHYKYLIDPAQGNYQHLDEPNPAGVMPAMDPSTGGGSLSIGPFDTGIQTPQVVDRSLAGMGQAVSSLGMGLKQRGANVLDAMLPNSLGLSNLITGQDPSRTAGLQAQEAEQRRLDAPLNHTTAGTLGNIGMNVGMMLPSLAVPGSSGLVGSSVMGSLFGAAQPTVSDNETAGNIGMGALGGPLGLGASRLLGGVTSGLGNFAKGFTTSGRDSILGNTLNRAAGGPMQAQAAIDAIKSAPQFPGVQNTVGMSSGNSGLATLQRAAASNPEVAELYDSRNRQNANTLLDAIRGLGGDDSALAVARATRDQASSPLYAAAKTQTVPTDSTIAGLLDRPSMQQALAKAQQIAKEKGETIVNPNGSYSVNGLHYIKLALDDLVENPGANALGRNEVNAIKDTRSSLLNWLDKASPDYAKARATYADASQPINAMKTGNALYDALSPAFNEMKTAKVINGSKFSTVLSNGDVTAQRATKYPGATLDNIFQPSDLQTLNGVNRSLGQMSDAMTLGKPPGSDTAKNLLTQNMLAGAGNPFNQALQNSVLAKTLMGPTFGFAAKYAAEPALQNRLSQILLDPTAAAEVMRKAMPGANPLQIQQAVDQLTQMSGRGLIDSAEQRRFQPASRQ